MAKLISIAILLVYISASLAQDINFDDSNHPTNGDSDHDDHPITHPDGSKIHYDGTIMAPNGTYIDPETIPIDRRHHDPIPATGSQSQVPDLGQIFNRIMSPNHERYCKDWQTVTLTMKDIDIPNNLMDIVSTGEVGVKNGDLKGRKVSLTALYDFDNKTNTARVCACHIEDTPCMPLCCQPKHVAAMKDRLLTCDKTTAEDPDLKLQFAKHLVEKEKLPADRFLIVHHKGLDSLESCSHAAHTYRPGQGQRIDHKHGNLTVSDQPPLDSYQYCFLPEKKGNQYHFTPVYCQPIKAENSAALLVATPLPTIAIAVASIAVLFLAAP